MARDAGRAGEVEVVINVACGARLGGVATRQCEAGGGVVERGAVPIGRAMTPGTILREGRLFVRRIVGVVVIGLVTAPAGAAGQAEVVVDVALGALHAGMRAGQGEAGSRMVVGGAGPVEGRSE